MPNTPPRELHRVASRSNALIKELRRAFAQHEPGESGLVAIEGLRMMEEALRSGIRLHAVFFREPAGKMAERLLGQISNKTETLAVPEDVFESAVLTESPQGVAALLEPKKFSLQEILSKPQPVVVGIAGVQDPGNLGTLLRSSEAFNAAGVLLLEGTVSAFNPKAVRAAAGSLFRLPTIKIKFAEALPLLREKKIRLIAGSSHKGTSLHQANLKLPLCLLIGNEGAGVPRAMLEAADELVSIPHSSKVESLNAAIAGSLMLYEAARKNFD